MEFDESDQAGLVGSIFSSHLASHKDHKPDPECPFCKGFILPRDNEPKEPPLESYSFILLDLSKDGK